MTELETRWRDLGEFIREQRNLGQLSLRKLSEMAGVSNPYLSQIERGLRKPSAEILQQIAKALHISAETLYVRAGILDEPTDTPDLVELLRRDPWLTEEQKKTMVTVYESFRTANDAAALAAGLLGDPPHDGGDEGSPAQGDAGTVDAVEGGGPDQAEAGSVDEADHEGADAPR